MKKPSKTMDVKEMVLAVSYSVGFAVLETIANELSVISGKPYDVESLKPKFQKALKKYGAAFIRDGEKPTWPSGSGF